MTAYLLTGLRPNNPLAVMAAYGVLRLLPGSRLRWVDAHPQLVAEVDPLDALVTLLPERRKAPEATLFDDPRNVENYVDLANALPSEWQLVTAIEGKEKSPTTDLLMLSGKHKFVTNARVIMEILSGLDVRDKLSEALYGAWRYDEKGLQAWGWDAGASIETAASGRDGATTPKYGVSGASWLAWEALPLWPMLNGRTTGWSRGLTYPTCAEWLGWHELRALILGLDGLPRRELEALGVRVWNAPRIASSKYGGYLGWGRSVARTSSDRQTSVRPRSW